MERKWWTWKILSPTESQDGEERERNYDLWDNEIENKDEIKNVINTDGFGLSEDSDQDDQLLENFEESG